MESYSLGIDLHRRSAYWTLVDTEQKILWHGSVPTTQEDTLLALKALPVSPATCNAVIEPVAEWGWYAELLETQGCRVVLANPLQVSLIAKTYSHLRNEHSDAMPKKLT